MTAERPFKGTATDQLEAEVDELEAELRTMRERPLRFTDVGHQWIDASVAAAERRIDQLLDDALRALANSGGSPLVVAGLGDLLALTQPGVADRWHALLDADQAAAVEAGAPMSRAGFRGGQSRASYDADRAVLDGELRQRKAELAIRAGEQKKREAEADAKRLLEEVTAA